MNFTDGNIHDVIVNEIKIFHDQRGSLAELFRHDGLDEEFYPSMAYISYTRPGVCRGPHEHVDQADLFCFLGPSMFKMRMWDTRPGSPTLGRVMTVFAGDENAMALIVPKGVVHGYENIGSVDGMVINCPNRLYMGDGKRSPIDEIRHEDDPETVFKMD